MYLAVYTVGGISHSLGSQNSAFVLLLKYKISNHLEEQKQSANDYSKQRQSPFSAFVSQLQNYHATIVA